MLLRDALYRVTIPSPTPAPDPGGGSFNLSPIYLRPIGGVTFGELILISP